LARAEPVVFARHPRDLPRLSEHPGWYECRTCSARAVCHEGEVPRRHCRSCVHVQPHTDGSWKCARWERELSLQRQHHGCPEWVPWP
jgi:hypothetical protein